MVPLEVGEHHCMKKSRCNLQDGSRERRFFMYGIRIILTMHTLAEFISFRLWVVGNVKRRTHKPPTNTMNVSAHLFCLFNRKPQITGIGSARITRSEIIFKIPLAKAVFDMSTHFA